MRERKHTDALSVRGGGAVPTLEAEVGRRLRGLAQRQLGLRSQVRKRFASRWGEVERRRQRIFEFGADSEDAPAVEEALASLFLVGGEARRHKPTEDALAGCSARTLSAWIHYFAHIDDVWIAWASGWNVVLTRGKPGGVDRVLELQANRRSDRRASLHKEGT